MTPQEQLVISLALQKGYISQTLLDNISRKLAKDQPPAADYPQEWQIIPVLLHNQDLSWDKLNLILKETQDNLSESISRYSPPGISDGDPSPSPAPASRRYQLEKLLGKGGAGEVFKAFDQQLNRRIALKRLKIEDGRLRTLLFREARTQARIDHENICQIYDVGEQDGYAFIAMQYINGRTLDDLSKELTLEEKVLLIREVAGALHVSHQHGLIHRDIKPSNIMIETNAEGKRKSFILDFGLARDQLNESITVSGDLIGLPHYMSPEQGRGDFQKIDRRTDIFSLGVTLYQILTGHLPFSGDHLSAVIMKVLQEEPRPPRQINPAIPVELDSIVLKCLEKISDQRYGSARELADDLGRFINGDPVLARRYGPWQKMVKKVKKHRALSLVIAISLTFIIILAGFWLRTRWRSNFQAQMAGEFGRDVQEMGSIMREAYLITPHDIRQDRELVKNKLGEIKGKIKQLGRLAEGPGNYALGQGYLALRQYEQARRHLERANQCGFQSTELSFGLGLTLGKLYRLESANAARIPDPGFRKKREAALQTELVQPALKLLHSARTAKSAPAGYVEALIAFYENRLADSLQILSQLKEKHLKYFEIPMLEGDVFQEMADRLWRSGQITAAFKKYDQALRFFQLALETGRSDPEVYLRFANLYQRLGFAQMIGLNQGVDENLTNALRYCDRALQLDPEFREALLTRIIIYTVQAYNKEWPDSAPFIHKGVQAARQLLRIHPDNETAYYLGGLCAQFRGLNTCDYKDDFIDCMKDAVHFFSLSLKINPNFMAARICQVKTWIILAQHQFFNGRDCWDTIRQAITHASTLPLRDAHDAELLQMMGSLHSLIASLKFEQGVVDWEDMAQSEKYYQNALAINPEDAEFNRNSANAFLLKAKWQSEYGIVPSHTLSQAQGLLEKANRINPGDGLNEVYLGECYLEAARFLLFQGKDPGKELKYAEEFLYRARKNRKQHYLISPLLLLADFIRCQRSYWQGSLSERMIVDAGEKYQQGLPVSGDYYELYAHYAMVLKLQIRSLIDQGKSPESIIKKTENLLHESLKLKKDSCLAHCLLAELFLQKAEISFRSRKNPHTELNRAERELNTAQAINPHSAEIQMLMARLALTRSMYLGPKTPNTSLTITHGLQVISQALDLNSNHAECWLIQGLLFQRKAQLATGAAARKTAWDSARKSFTRCRALNLLVGRNLLHLIRLIAHGD